MVLKLKNAAIKTFRLGRGFIIPERAGKSYPFQREKVRGILEVWKGGEGRFLFRESTSLVGLPAICF